MGDDSCPAGLREGRVDAFKAAMTSCAFLNQRYGQVLFKALLHKLMTSEIRIADLDLSVFIHCTDRLGDI